jgi:hypothetical protein
VATKDTRKALERSNIMDPTPYNEISADLIIKHLNKLSANISREIVDRTLNRPPNDFKDISFKNLVDANYKIEKIIIMLNNDKV